MCTDSDIAVGGHGNDPFDATFDGIDSELVLSTLNGDLVVYDLEPQGSSVTLGTLLFHQVYDGALGATNSIVIDDSQSDIKVLYVAGSMGTRKFTNEEGS